MHKAEKSPKIGINASSIHIYVNEPSNYTAIIKPSIFHNVHYSSMTDIKKDLKNMGQDAEAKINTAEDHAEGKPSSETLNKAKVKAGDAASDLKRDI